MTCQTLQQLRTEATALKTQIQEQQAKMRSARSHERRGEGRATSDLSLFLQRKLARMSQRIEQHISEHQCQN